MCFIYFIGWDFLVVQLVCGLEVDVYKIGSCKVNWVYWIVIICMVDVFVFSYFFLMFIECEIEVLNVMSLRCFDEIGIMEDGRIRRMVVNGYYNQDIIIF